MDKSCDNCYWEGYPLMFCIYKKERPIENTCDKHSFECECENKAEYTYKNKYYCQDCLLKMFEVEESSSTTYYRDGEYIGSDDDDMDEMICDLDEGIRTID